MSVCPAVYPENVTVDPEAKLQQCSACGQGVRSFGQLVGNMKQLSH